MGKALLQVLAGFFGSDGVVTADPPSKEEPLHFYAARGKHKPKEGQGEEKERQNSEAVCASGFFLPWGRWQCFALPEKARKRKFRFAHVP